MPKSNLKKLQPLGNPSSEFRPWRSIKMAEPICTPCQEVAGGPDADWYKRCPHEPYLTVEDVPEKTPVIETDEDGERIITDWKTRLIRKETLNLRQIAYETRINSAKGVDWAKANGLKLPEEMGLAPFCQYGDCWSQNLRVRNAVWGDYCSELHAKLVIADAEGTPLEVLDGERRAEQIRKIAL